MASIATALSAPRMRVPYFVPVVSKYKSQSRVRASGDSTLTDTVTTNGASFAGEKDRVGYDIDVGNGVSGLKAEEKNTVNNGLEVLWDDGYGTAGMKDYFDRSKEMIKPDGGPPRWFCPIECGCPIKNSPVLFYLPGLDGVGLGLILHHRSLGKVFEVRCLHIPVYDRTPFEGLVEFVENSVRLEHSVSPDKPIYIIGDSTGGCLALAVAARNHSIDLVLILSNPAISFGKSQLQPLLPILETMPDGLHSVILYLLNFNIGDPMKMAMINVENGLPSMQALEQLSQNLIALLSCLSVLADIIPKETLLWRLKVLKSAIAYSNSRLHAIKAEVLLLISGKDYMLSRGDDAQQLSNKLQKCNVCYFKDNGHALLLENGVNLLTVIKGKAMFRRSRKHDYVSDFLPPSRTEFNLTFGQGNWFSNLATSPVMFSTLEDGNIVRGLQGVPDEGPVLLVGYHMLMGFELAPLVEEFLRQKKVMIRGTAHHRLFLESVDRSVQEFFNFDKMRVFGALPVSARNLFKLLSTNSHVLLYPGGAREALHYKGEAYKLFWPDKAEFVRMAARFGATIVPFGTVGEDDIAELVLDYNDIMKIPFLGDFIREHNEKAVNFRADAGGEVANQKQYIPGLLPKIPGRFYYIFGKPIETKGRVDLLTERESANVLYLTIKSEIERMMTFLLKKRQEDPYRGIVERTIYKAISAPINQVPAFDP